MWRTSAALRDRPVSITSKASSPTPRATTERTGTPASTIACKRFCPSRTRPSSSSLIASPVSRHSPRWMAAVMASRRRREPGRNATESHKRRRPRFRKKDMTDSVGSVGKSRRCQHLVLHGEAASETPEQYVPFGGGSQRGLSGLKRVAAPEGNWRVSAQRQSEPRRYPQHVHPGHSAPRRLQTRTAQG